MSNRKRPLATPTSAAAARCTAGTHARDASGRFVAKSKPLDLTFLVDPRKTVNQSRQSKVQSYSPPRNQKMDPDGWQGFLEDSLEGTQKDEWEWPGAGMWGCMHSSLTCGQPHNPHHLHFPDNPLLGHTLDTLKQHWRYLSNRLAACNAQLAKAAHSRTPFVGESTTKFKITHLEKSRQTIESRLETFREKVGRGWKIPEWVKLVAGGEDYESMKVWDAWLKRCEQVEDAEECEICGTREWMGPVF